MSITKEKIVKQAVILLNQDGLENLSMRTLAESLNIKAASLYWHIKNKDDLLGELADYICTGIIVDCKNSLPKENLKCLCLLYRDKLLMTRNSVDIMLKTPPNTPNRIRLIKDLVECIKEMGINESNLLTAANLLNNYVLSFVSDELIYQSSNDLEITEFFSSINKSASDNRLDFQNQFDYGLNVILTGLETHETMLRGES